MSHFEYVKHVQWYVILQPNPSQISDSSVGKAYYSLATSLHHRVLIHEVHQLNTSEGLVRACDVLSYKRMSIPRQVKDPTTSVNV